MTALKLITLVLVVLAGLVLFLYLSAFAACRGCGGKAVGVGGDLVVSCRGEDGEGCWHSGQNM